MSDHLAQIAGLLAALAVGLGLWGYVMNRQSRRLDERLQLFVGAGSPSPEARRTQRLSPLRRFALWRRLSLGARPLQLIQAGVSLSPRLFLFVQVIVMLVALAATFVVGRRLDLSGVGLAVALPLGLACGFAIPRLALQFKRRRRLRQFEAQFANALDSLSNAMEVGLSLPQAFEILARDMPAPLGPEFAQVVRELGVGLPVGEALDGLAQRVPLQDVEIFVAAVHIQYRTGGGLSQVLRTIAATVRQRVNLRGEIRSMTGQQRYSAYLISGLPVFIALIMKFVSPAYFERLLEPGAIRFLLLGAAGGVVVGYYFMMRIADIEV